MEHAADELKMASIPAFHVDGTKMIGHKARVTAIACPSNRPGLVISASMDIKSIVLWERTGAGTFTAITVGQHRSFVQDVVISSDGQFALCGCWYTITLWNLIERKPVMAFFHGQDYVMCVALSDDAKTILSGSRNGTIKVWDTSGTEGVSGRIDDWKNDCKHTIQDQDAHDGENKGVSCLRFLPTVTPDRQLFVSGGGDKVLKVWNLNTCQILARLAGHTGSIKTVAVTPNGGICASGGEDGRALLWNMAARGKRFHSINANSSIHALCFCPNKNWLCIATKESIKMWNLESMTILKELRVECQNLSIGRVPYCISLTWNADGTSLYSGYTDGNILVWN